VIEDHFVALSEAAHRTRAAAPVIAAWGAQLARTLSAGGRLLACGNGGSAAEAQHLTGELVGRYRLDRGPYSAIALHTDTSAATAILNDYGEHQVFARQVRAHGRPGDILVALSTSGRSENVVAAVKDAQDLGLHTWAITGPAPNPLCSLCESAITVDAATTATVQELHLSIIHALCEAFDAEIGAGRRPTAGVGG
jgi:D-sedoheptulose 7-phosphate isomerase